MRLKLASVAFFCGLAGAVHAQGFFPAADVFQLERAWDDPAFVQAWAPASSPTRTALKTYPDNPPIFGVSPQLVIARFEGQRIESISFVFHDAGFFFGYTPGGDQDPDAKTKEQTYDAEFQTKLVALRNGLAELAGKKGSSGEIGKRFPTRLSTEIYEHGEIASRLVAVPNQLIKLTLFRTVEEAASPLDPEFVKLDDRDRDALFLQNVREDAAAGDKLIGEIPIFPQGNRAYCGVSALSMTLHYLGLNLETEELAAGSGIRYGSTRKMLVREIYVAAADEGGIRATRSTKFDFKRAKDSIDAGIPVVVFRRYDQQRDYLHTNFARRFESDPAAELPKPDLNDQATWPGKDAPAHATIVNGYNDKRGEVIFTESWGEHVRNRRMRVEEMEGTSYYAFYFRF